MNLQTVFMTGKSHHGKNRIAETKKRLGAHWDGRTWLVKATKDRIIARSAVGPWALVSPVTDMNTDFLSRWVNLREDVDFIITHNAKVSGAGKASPGLPG